MNDDKEPKAKTESHRQKDASKKPLKHQSSLFNNILEDTTWIEECAEYFIEDEKARKQFVIDMNWFVGNHSDRFFNEKSNAYEIGIYYGREKDNEHVIERLHKYMNNKLQNNSPKMKWLVEKYQLIPIDDIIDFLRRTFIV